VLSEFGLEYFAGAIPGLANMVPGIIGTSISNPRAEGQAHTSANATSLANLWTSTPFDAMWQAAGDLLGVDKTFAKVVVFLLFAVGVVVVLFRSGLQVPFHPVLVVLLLFFGVLLGSMIPLFILVLFIMGCVLVIGYFLFYRSAF
jgi:hypothetical protein